MHTFGYFRDDASNTATTSERQSVYPTPRKPIGKQNISNRSNKLSQVICKTLYHSVENYGSQIPVKVVEALKFARSASCSAKMSKDGWAWLVIGRSVYIWQAIGGSFNSYRKLPLPPSGLVHKANLVSVFASHGNQVVSCIALSPEGVIRYWANIASEDISVEYNADLQGQECESIHCIMPIGFILATTTASILLVELSSISSTCLLSCRSLTSPSGWLGGIGRKMTSLIFGAISSVPSDMKLVKVFVHSPDISMIQSVGGCSYKVYVLAGTLLQKWSLVTGDPEKLIYECNLHQLVASNFLQTVWGDVTDVDEVEITFVDFQLNYIGNETNIVLFVSAVNRAVSNLLHYAFVTINVDSDSAPVKTASFHMLKNIDFSSFVRENDLKSTQFLITGNTAYLYNNKIIICIPVIGGYDEVDEIIIPETSILGGTVHNETPVFFSHTHGFVSLTVSDITLHDFTSNLLATTNSEISSSLYDMNESGTAMEDSFVPLDKDGSASLKAAFLHYVSKRIGQCKALVNETFPLDSSVGPQMDSMLDSVVIKVSLDLIDDVPARDPRWANMKTDGLNMNSTSSLQISNQLNEKQGAFNLYLTFLNDTGLWKKLSAVTHNNMMIATVHVLAEHSEKLFAAIVFRKLQMKYVDITEPVIKKVLQKMHIQPASGLTFYDVFFRQVSIIHEGLNQLCESCNDFVHEDHNVQNVVNAISKTNTILLEVLSEVHKFRNQQNQIFIPSENIMTNFGCEMLPWTVAPGKNGLRDSLMSQVNVIWKYGVQSAGNLATRQELLNQMISLINIILEGWEIHLNSLQPKLRTKYDNLLHKYENERLELIQILLEEEEYEQAALMAEKFCDFTILVQLCEKTDDFKKLEYYMDKFSKREFSRFLFSYYIQEKKPGKLLTQFKTNEKYHLELSNFLLEHPSIGWIHAAFFGDYLHASNTLLTLAFQETEFMRRKKTMLSLGKMALLACENLDAVTFERVNRELNLIAYQEDLRESVLITFGYDFETIRVFLPAELIRFYICEENTEATEMDFAKAIDLLQFVDDEEEQTDLRNEIWCKAILRNDWPGDEFNVTNIIEFLNQFLFFRIIELCFKLDKREMIINLIPQLEQILDAEDLGELRHNTTFQYLMKVGYEHYIRQ